MKSRFLISLTALFLLSASQINAQNGGQLRLSLDEAKKMALENNVSIRNSAIDIEMAKKKIWETTALGLPHFDVKAAYQHVFNPPMISFGPGTPSFPIALENNTTFDFTLSQLIFNGAYIVGLQASKTYSKMTEINDSKVKMDVMESVTNNYYMILVAEQSAENLKKNLANVKSTQADISEMNKQGFVELTDVEQLEVTTLSIENVLNQINSNIDVAYRLLKIQLGVDENVQVALKDSLTSGDQLLQNAIASTMQTFSADKNIDYQVVKVAEKLTKLDYQREVTTFLPTVTAFYNHNEKANAPVIDFSVKDIVGVNVAIPVFSSGERMAKVSQKKMALQKAQNTTANVAENLAMAAGQLKNEVKMKIEKHDIQKKSLALSESIYNRTLEKYKQGVASGFELMNMQNQYLNSVTNYYQSIFELINAKTKLDKHLNINQ